MKIIIHPEGKLWGSDEISASSLCLEGSLAFLTHASLTGSSHLVIQDSNEMSPGTDAHYDNTPCRAGTLLLFPRRTYFTFALPFWQHPCPVLHAWSPTFSSGRSPWRMKNAFISGPPQPPNTSHSLIQTEVQSQRWVTLLCRQKVYRPFSKPLSCGRTSKSSSRSNSGMVVGDSERSASGNWKMLAVQRV